MNHQITNPPPLSKRKRTPKQNGYQDGYSAKNRCHQVLQRLISWGFEHFVLAETESAELKLTKKHQTLKTSTNWAK